MSSSEAQTKIDLLDPPELVEAKIQSAACPRVTSSTANKDAEETEAKEQNGVLAFFEYVVFAVESNVQLDNATSSCKSIKELRAAFNNEHVSEEQLKRYLAAFLNRFLAKVRAACDNDETRDLLARAYPPADSATTIEDETAASKADGDTPTLNDDDRQLLAKLGEGGEVSTFRFS